MNRDSGTTHSSSYCTYDWPCSFNLHAWLAARSGRGKYTNQVVSHSLKGRRVLCDYALKYFKLPKTYLHVVALAEISVKTSGPLKPLLIEAASSKFTVYQHLYLPAFYLVLHAESLPPSPFPYRI